MGLKTGIIERHKLGGTCLHYGCIPTKPFLQVLTCIRSFRSGPFGAHGREHWDDYPQILKFKHGVVDKNWQGVQFLMKKNKIDVIYGDGIANLPDSVRVKTEDGEQEISTTNLVVATGSRPRTFGLPIDGRTVFTSDHAVNLDAMPKSLIVLGGGVISVEFVSLRITVVRRRGHNCRAIADTDSAYGLRLGYRTRAVVWTPWHNRDDRHHGRFRDAQGWKEQCFDQNTPDGQGAAGAEGGAKAAAVGDRL